MARRRLDARIRRQRGMTLIEALAATVVLLTGILGALSAVVAAVRQNTFASRITRATEIAYQIRAGLEAQGSARLRASGGALAENCDNALLASATFGIESQTYSPTPSGIANVASVCSIDLDKFEKTTATPDTAIVPGYSTGNDDSKVFKRVLVDFREQSAGTLVANRVAIIVSWLEPGNVRNKVVQYVTLVAPTPHNGNFNYF